MTTATLSDNSSDLCIAGIGGDLIVSSNRMSLAATQVYCVGWQIEHSVEDHARMQLDLLVGSFNKGPDIRKMMMEQADQLTVRELLTVINKKLERRK